MKLSRLAGLLLAASLCCSKTYATLCDDFSHGRAYVGPSLFVQQVSANESSYRGLHPRFSLGYADWSNKYYLAAELFLVPASLTLSDIRNNGGSGTSTKISSSFGASLLPGTLIYKKILGYLRFGLISSYFRSPGSSKMGGQLGFGIQTRLTSEWALRGEYLYTAYNSVSQIGTPNSNELGLGLIYFFNT
jgi:opacity protein-like surface antigen